MAHNCIANVGHIIDDQFRMIARASVPVKRGESLFLSYTHTAQGTKERRSILRQGKYFECNCARCSDPTEGQTYVSAFKCQKCSVGNVLAMKPLEVDTDWQCDRCSYRLTCAVVDKITNKLQHQLDAIGHNDVELFEGFLQSHTSLLHPNHYFFTSARHSLSQLYGRDRRYLLDTLSPALLQRKINICQSLLSIADVLEPGLSRIRGVTLYEMHAPIIMLARNRYQNKEISQEEFKERMLQARDILEETYRILSLEPAQSAEGVMAQASQTALRQMQQWVKFN